MKYFLIAFAAFGAAVIVVSNEIGKFIDDISPYDWNDFDRHDVGNDFDSSDYQWK